jgi:hypothetical protein
MIHMVPSSQAAGSSAYITGTVEMVVIPRLNCTNIRSTSIFRLSYEIKLPCSPYFATGRDLICNCNRCMYRIKGGKDISP